MITSQCRKGILASLIFNGTADTNLFNHWLEKCLIPELKPGKTIVLDNYVIHKSERTRSLVEKAANYIEDFHEAINSCILISIKL